MVAFYLGMTQSLFVASRAEYTLEKPGEKEYLETLLLEPKVHNPPSVSQHYVFFSPAWLAEKALFISAQIASLAISIKN